MKRITNATTTIHRAFTACMIYSMHEFHQCWKKYMCVEAHAQYSMYSHKWVNNLLSSPTSTLLSPSDLSWKTNSLLRNERHILCKPEISKTNCRFSTHNWTYHRIGNDNQNKPSTTCVTHAKRLMYIRFCPIKNDHAKHLCSLSIHLSWLAQNLDNYLDRLSQGVN